MAMLPQGHTKPGCCTATKDTVTFGQRCCLGPRLGPWSWCSQGLWWCPRPILAQRVIGTMSRWASPALHWPCPSLDTAAGELALSLRGELHPSPPALRKDGPTLHHRCVPHLGSTLELTLWSGRKVSQLRGQGAGPPPPTHTLSSMWWYEWEKDALPPLTHFYLGQVRGLAPGSHEWKRKLWLILAAAHKTAGPPLCLASILELILWLGT